MSTDTEQTAGEQTKQRVLAAAVAIARADGIEAVTHKGVAAATDLSSSNVTYYYGKAIELRRAAAHQLITEIGSPLWGTIEFYVQHDGKGGEYPLEADDLSAAEAYVWLARNGVIE